MDTATLDLSGLTEHGDILELDDSRRLRLLIEGKDIADTPEQRQLIRDLMTWGFSSVAVVLEKRCDFGHWHEVEHHGCGGCDSVYPELISDLVGEVLG